MSPDAVHSVSTAAPASPHLSTGRPDGVDTGVGATRRALGADAGCPCRTLTRTPRRYLRPAAADPYGPSHAHLPQKSRPRPGPEQQDGRLSVAGRRAAGPVPPRRVRAARRRRTSPPSSPCSAACCCPRTRSPTSSRSLRRHDFYRPGAPDHLRRRSSTCTAAASRPTPITVAAELTKRGEIARVGGAPYLHTLIAVRAHRGQRRLLRRDRRASARSCAGWSRPAPASSRWATPPTAATSTTSSTGRRPRSTTSPSGAPARTTSRSATIMEGTLDEIEAIGSPRRRDDRRAHRLRRPRRADQRPAPRPDDRRRGAPGDGQVHAGAGLRPRRRRSSTA